jgi:hypothetical protein
MFLRSYKRKKNGKDHRYYSVVENRRVSGGQTVQRQVLYLGEINDSQEAAWRKTLEVIDEKEKKTETLSLFPEDRPIPADAVNGVHVRMTAMELRKPRSYGDCWLGCELWHQLGLDAFWEKRLGDLRGEVPWAKVLELLVVNRLIEPGSEFRVHRLWFERSAMGDLLGVTYAAAGKDRLYRCLDLLEPHRVAVFQHLRARWVDLFSATFDVLLYDLTSTYFEGLCEEIPKAKHGYSRDGRPDCRQVVIALVVTPQGLPLAYEVMPGNTSDRTTLRGFLNIIEERYGKARRAWLMDRGVPTEDLLTDMRQEEVQYLVGTPRGHLTKLEQAFLAKPWKEVHEGVTVKLLEQSGEVYVLARSGDRQKKEQAIRRKKLKRFLNGLAELRKQAPERDRLLEKLGVLKKEAGRAARLVELRVPKPEEAVSKATFSIRFKMAEFKAAQARDGQYLLRTNMKGEDPERLWEQYMRMTEIEAAFKCLKSELAVRPIHHQVEPRVEAHIFVAFLAYALMATLRLRLGEHAPGLTPRAVMDKLGAIQMIDVWLPTTDGRWLVMPRYTQPEAEQKILLDLLRITLPAQPPPRIQAVHPEPKPEQGKLAFCGEDL